MSNTMVAGIYIPFAIMTTLILLQVFLRSVRHQGNILFMLLILLVICWYASAIPGALAARASTAVFLWNFILVFVGFIPPVLLLFVLDFYRVPLKRTVWPLVFVVPCINTVMVLTSKYHSLVYVRLTILSLAPYQQVVREWGPWFWVHTIHCYIISAIIIGVLLIRHFRLPRFYRFPSVLIATGIALTLVANVITLYQILPAALDPTLIGTSLALMLFYFAIVNNDRSKFVRYSIGKVFDYLNLYVLVLDEDNRLVSANRPAQEWFSSLGIAMGHLSLHEITQRLERIGAVQSQSEQESGVDFSFPSEPLAIVLNRRVQAMEDANGDHIGSVAIFTDVTQNRLLLRRLEDKAGLDSLTGIANRMAYEGAATRLDTPEHLPLSVILCDVNGLKAVNDSLGHQYGDRMLQVISEIMEAACPNPGFLARIGGDEFVYLLPRTSQEDAGAFINTVSERLESRTDLPFPLSVAIGAATKQQAGEDLAKIVDLADGRMYENKRLMKSQQQN